MTGAQAIVECLHKQGVNTVFGYPGGTILPLYDALYEAPVKHVLTTHEQGAAHAADGYARASGKVGVCIATAGPGATNLVTGLANAFMDSVPVVAITGQVPTGLIGRDAFQEVDITGITMAVTKHNFLVKDIKKLPSIIEQAFAIASSGRMGPVLVDVPRDIQAAQFDFSHSMDKISFKDCHRRHYPDNNGAVQQAAAAVNAAIRPVILVGGGVIAAGASQGVIELAEQGDIPVVSTLMGIGGFPASHSNYLGMTGLHGLRLANRAVQEADVLIVIGSRFSDRVTGDRSRYSQGKAIIHIDIDPAEIQKNVAAHLGLVGDMVSLLAVLNRYVEKQSRTQWRQTINSWQEEQAVSVCAGSLSAPWVMEELNRLTASQDTIFVTDVGQHQMWAAQYLKVERPRNFLSSGGLGAMGFGLPAAVGAQLAAPEKRVVHIAGDGGFKMTGCELYTVAVQKLPVISLIINNSGLGMIRQQQKAFYNSRFSAAVLPAAVDFTLFANSFGIQAYSTSSKDEFTQAFATVWAQNKPAVIVVNISCDDMVSPMLLPGGALDEYIDI
ncbi:biosynthetic-type acetolactate synthase large subunit [Methylomusa anaerophila]